MFEIGYEVFDERSGLFGDIIKLSRDEKRAMVLFNNGDVRWVDVDDLMNGDTAAFCYEELGAEGELEVGY